MKRFVITIGREFGCNASEVGRELAARLGVKFYEKELVVRAAAVAGIDEDSISNPDRKVKRNDITHLMQYFINEFGYGITSSYFSEKAIGAQAYVIRQIANTESCVMFGRCADYFLSEFGNTLNVFLYRPAARRISPRRPPKPPIPRQYRRRPWNLPRRPPQSPRNRQSSSSPFRRRSSLRGDFLSHIKKSPVIPENGGRFST